MKDNKWRLSGTEAQEWYFRLMNDPKQFEKFRFKDTIDDFKKSKKDLAKTQAEYDEFKKYKTRTAISR
jgi:hypothetical protein